MASPSVVDFAGSTSEPEGPHAAARLPRWSAAAVGGFVLSLLGFVGVTAVLGLVFGIVGIVRTRGNVRRGRGLAIAAIPISLVTGLLSLVILALVLWATTAGQAISHLRDVLKTESPESVAALREVCSKDLNAAVDAERMLDWLHRVRQTHGSLVKTEGPVPRRNPSAKEVVTLTMPAKFVNGPTIIGITFSYKGRWKLKIDDMDVDGSSPRDPP